MTSNELLTREEVLAGLPAKQASLLLFLIESRTAHLVAQSRQAMERFLTEETANERNFAFFEAFSLARQPPLRPTIQDLERHAPQCAILVPEDPKLRAAIAHALGQKYDFTYRAVPGIRAALGLDKEAVRRAYQRLYDEPLETIFVPRAALADRLRWVSAALAGWLESLPPFWTAFALTLTETVGAGILALPIAVAGVGPLAGVVLLVVLGLMNVLTIASMAEAVARSGTIRYGGGFIGRAVADYLGSAGSFILSTGLATLCFVILLAYYVGFSTTLADATSLPAEVWAVLLFLIGLYFLRRKSLNATVASALLVGVINIGLILILSLVAFTHVRSANLLYVNVPFIGGRPFDPSILQLIFGVILAAYFGHLSVSNCAKVVLRRDPSARSLIWGNVAALAAAMLLYSVWVLAVNGAIGSQALARQSGTALIPLAAEVGSGVRVLGSVFVILGMGMASIHFTLGLANLVRERLPTLRRPVVTLPRRRGKLILHERGRRDDLRLGLTYLGLTGDRPRFRLDLQAGGQRHRLEIAVGDRWEAAELRDRLPDSSIDSWLRGLRFTLEVLDADQGSACLRVTSPLALTYEGEWDTAGLSMANLLTLPDPLRQAVTWMMRQGPVSPAEVAEHINQDEDAARTTLEALAEQGFVQRIETEGAVRYRAQLAHRRGRGLPEEIWQALDDMAEAQTRDSDVPRPSGAPAIVQRLRRLVLGERGRSLLSASPAVVIFLLTEWLFFSGAESFARPLSILGVIVISLLAGIFPVLLLASSRRKGECAPGVVFRFLGHPLVLGIIYALSWVSLLLHGLVIWEDPVERAIALSVGLLVLGVTAVMARRGAFAPRAVVELREDQSEEREAVFAVTAGGQPATADVRLAYPEGERHYRAAAGEVPTFSSLRRATFQLPAGQLEGQPKLADELKVWVHRVTPDGDSEGLPALLEVHCGEETTQFDLKLSGGQAMLPLTSEPCRIEIALE